jgi:hypothetical protein
MPRAKFSSNAIAVLNFRLKSFHSDTGDLGKILEPFAGGFFPNENEELLIFEHIIYDLQSKLAHQRKVNNVFKRLNAARWVFRSVVGSTYLIYAPLRGNLKAVIILITTHAAYNTGCLGITSTHYVGIKEVRNSPYVFILLNPAPCISGSPKLSRHQSWI